MNISQSPNLEQHEKDDIAFLRGTLIPDLRESDSDLTADDFQRCIDLIERLDARLTVITKLLPS